MRPTLPLRHADLGVVVCLFRHIARAVTDEVDLEPVLEGCEYRLGETDSGHDAGHDQLLAARRVDAARNFGSDHACVVVRSIGVISGKASLISLKMGSTRTLPLAPIVLRTVGTPRAFVARAKPATL
jgi:hypothetical protein